MRKIGYFIIGAWIIGFLMLAIGMWMEYGAPSAFITFGCGIFGLVILLPTIVFMSDNSSNGW